MQTFIFQTRNDVVNSEWVDFKLITGITGREACYLAAEKEEFINRFRIEGEPMVLVRAKLLNKVKK